MVEDGIAPDIAELLKQIRAQYEQMVMKNKDEAEQWYKSKVSLLIFVTGTLPAEGCVYEIRHSFYLINFKVRCLDQKKTCRS